MILQRVMCLTVAGGLLQSILEWMQKRQFLLHHCNKHSLHCDPYLYLKKHSRYDFRQVHRAIIILSAVHNSSSDKMFR